MNESSSPSSASSFSFGIVMSVSTCSVSSAMPCSALRARCRPSKRNGLVTTPTVRAPSSFASWAMTGAAPVPVPPPMPAVMNTMSAPEMASLMRVTSSSAALRPFSGSAPAPKPLVTAAPMPILTAALFELRACASVLIATNSTPSRPKLIIVLTALPPEPPHPTTLIRAWYSWVSSANSIEKLIVSSRIRLRLLRAVTRGRLFPRVGD